MTNKKLLLVVALVGGGYLLWRSVGTANAAGVNGPLYLSPDLLDLLGGRELTDAEKAAGALQTAGALAGTGLGLAGAIAKFLGGGTAAETARQVSTSLPSGTGGTFERTESAFQEQRTGERQDYSTPSSTPGAPDLSIPDLTLATGGVVDTSLGVPFTLYGPGGGNVLLGAGAPVFTLQNIEAAVAAPILSAGDFTLGVPALDVAGYSASLPTLAETGGAAAFASAADLPGAQILSSAFDALQSGVTWFGQITGISGALSTVLVAEAAGGAVLVGSSAASAVAAGTAVATMTVGTLLAGIGPIISGLILVVMQPGDYVRKRKREAGGLALTLPVIFYRMANATTRDELRAAVTTPGFGFGGSSPVRGEFTAEDYIVVRGVHLDTQAIEAQLNTLYRQQLALLVAAAAGNTEARAALARIAEQNRARRAALDVVRTWMHNRGFAAPLALEAEWIARPDELAAAVSAAIRELTRPPNDNPDVAGLRQLEAAARALELDVVSVDDALREAAVLRTNPQLGPRGELYAGGEGGMQSDAVLGGALPGVFVSTPAPPPSSGLTANPGVRYFNAHGQEWRPEAIGQAVPFGYAPEGTYFGPAQTAYVAPSGAVFVETATGYVPTTITYHGGGEGGYQTDSNVAAPALAPELAGMLDAMALERAIAAELAVLNLGFSP